MSQQELLKQVAAALDAAGIAYMVTGSVASSAQGEPRSTHDIDIVVNMERSAAVKIVGMFCKPEFYLDYDAVVSAIDSGGMFNLIDVREGDKVDFWLLTGQPFDQARFHRREKSEIAGIPLYISRPEDTILMKLLWSHQSGGSEKQFTDALRVYEVQFGQLDLEYIYKWVGILGLGDLWTQLQQQAIVSI